MGLTHMHEEITELSGKYVQSQSMYRSGIFMQREDTMSFAMLDAENIPFVDWRSSLVSQM